MRARKDFNLVSKCGFLFLLSTFYSCDVEKKKDDKTQSSDVLAVEQEQAFANSVSELPECEEKIQGKIFIVKDSKQLSLCTVEGWEQLDFTGAAGAAGGEGDDGAAGAKGDKGEKGDAGAKGDTGAKGAKGAAGASTLFTTTTIAPSSKCPGGGVELKSGLDANANGILDTAEATATQLICTQPPQKQVIYDKSNKKLGNLSYEKWQGAVQTYGVNGATAAVPNGAAAQSFKFEVSNADGKIANPPTCSTVTGAGATATTTSRGLCGCYYTSIDCTGQCYVQGKSNVANTMFVSALSVVPPSAKGPGSHVLGGFKTDSTLVGSAKAISSKWEGGVCVDTRKVPMKLFISATLPTETVVGLNLMVYHCSAKNKVDFQYVYKLAAKPVTKTAYTGADRADCTDANVGKYVYRKATPPAAAVSFPDLTIPVSLVGAHVGPFSIPLRVVTE